MAVQRHDRLVYFIRHLQQTTGQLQNMESRVIAGEQNHPSVASEDWGVVLENLQNVKRHILTSLLPIKERLEMQLYGPPTGGRGPARLGPAPSDQHGVHSRPVGGGGGGLGSYGYPPHRGGGHPTQQMHPHHVAQHHADEHGHHHAVDHGHHLAIDHGYHLSGQWQAGVLSVWW